MRGRGDRLAELVAERELDLLLVTDLVNVRYLTGFGGTNGACLCGAEHARLLHRLPLHRARRGRGRGLGAWSRSSDDWLGGIAERFAGHGRLRGRPRLGAAARAARGESCPRASSWSPPAALVEQLRRVKDEDELAAIAAAAELADEVWRWSARAGPRRPHRARGRRAPPKRGSASSAPSPPSRRSSPPARTARCRTPSRASARSARASWSSSTWARSSTATARTAPAPSPPASPASEAREVYELVLRGAGRRARGGRAPASPGEAVDAVAREVIEAAGHGERFGHGLGHGVGLEVHEAPRLSQRSEDALAAGEVVTVEPGVYLPGELGVRIEDLVVVTDEGHRNLSGLPKELQIVA